MFGPWGTLIGAGIGSTVGGLGGVISAFASGAYKDAKEAAEMTQKTLTDEFAAYLVKEGKPLTADQIAAWLGQNSELYKENNEATKAIVDELYSVQDELKQYGSTLQNNKQQLKAYNDTLKQQVLSMIDVNKYTDEQIESMSGFVSDFNIDFVKNEIKTKIESLDEGKDLGDISFALSNEYKEYFKKLYGETVKIGWHGEVDYREGGEPKNISQEQAQAMFIMAKAMDDLEADMSKLPTILNSLAKDYNIQLSNAFSAALQNEGLGLTQAQLDIFMSNGEINEQLIKSLWALNDDLSEAMAYQPYLETMVAFIENGYTALNDSRVQFEEWGIRGFQNLNGEALKGLMQHFEQIVAVSNEQQAQNLAASIEKLLSEVEVKDQTDIARILNGISWSNLNELETLPDIFDKLGYTIPTESLQNFIVTARDAAHAIHMIDMKKLNEQLLDLNNVLNEIRINNQNRKFDKDIYDKIVAAVPSLKSMFSLDLDGSYNYLGTSMQELTKAIQDNTIALVDEQQKNYANQLSARAIMDAMAKSSDPAQDITKLIGYSAGGQEQREYIWHLVQEAVEQSRSLDGISTFLSTGLTQDEVMNKLSDEVILQILSDLRKMGTTDQIADEMYNSLLQPGVLNNLGQNPYYNVISDSAKNAAQRELTPDESADYAIHRTALMNQSISLGLSTSDLKLAAAYNQYLTEMERTLETNTEEYRKMAKEANNFYNQLMGKASFEV